MNSITPPISVLCVDDEPGMADLIGTYLQHIDDQISVTTAMDVEEATNCFENGAFDCIVSDYDMPEANGLDFLETVREDCEEFPFILYTGRGSEEIASEAISKGVTDYMQKQSGDNQYEVLAQRIRNAVSRERLSREAETAKEHAETIIKSSTNSILVAIDGECVSVNPAGMDLFGVTREEEILGESIHDLLIETGPTPFHDDVNSGGEYKDHRLTASTNNGDIPVEGTIQHVTWDNEPAVVYNLRDITKRIENENEIAYQKSLLSAVFDASPDGIHITTEDWDVVKSNDKFHELWDLDPELLSTGDSKTALDSVLNRVVNADEFLATIKHQYNNPGETNRSQVKLKDGTVFDQYSTGVTPKHADSPALIWFYRDITDIVNLEATKRQAFDRMTDAVFVLDENKHFTFLNSQAEAVLSRNADDLIGKYIWDEFPEAINGKLYRQYEKAEETGEAVTFELSADVLGKDFRVNAYPSPTGLTAYFEDITEEKRQKAELERTVTALHELYVTASDPDMTLDVKQQNILRAASKYLDLPIGFITNLTEDTQTITAAIGSNKHVQPGETCPLEESYCGKTIQTDCGLLAIRDVQSEWGADDDAYQRFQLGTYIGGQVMVNDELSGTICFASEEPRDREFSAIEQTFVEMLTRWLTHELEQRDHRAKLEEKNAQLEQFANVISHDLRNPLNVASGYLDIVDGDYDTENKNIEHIRQAHTRMQELIEDILLLARGGDIIREQIPVTLSEVAETCWENVDTEDAVLRVESEQTLTADESRLAQLLENLIRNSVEHGGHDVTITIGDLDNGFYIEDTGIGISDAVKSTLFQMGESSKNEGTGIGLRIVEQITTAHNWHITASNAVDGGARFEITGVKQVTPTVTN